MSALKLSALVRDRAYQLSGALKNEGLLRGRFIEVIAAASVHRICRRNGLSRSLDEVSEMPRVEEFRVANAHEMLKEKLGLPANPVSFSMFFSL